MIKVIGVKADNDESNGGRNRQDILKEFVDNGKDKILVDAEYDKADDTIKLREHETNQVIGVMCRKTTNRILVSKNNKEQYIGYIAYKGCYCVRLGNLNQS